MKIPPIPGVVAEEELGRGAHSIVYRGRRRGVAVAVKVPIARTRWTRWIYREAVALARVRHPGLPTVFEVGEIDGLPYLVMELVDGETLADRIARGPLPEAEALEIAQGLAEILVAVHGAGLIHRDVKPRNVILPRRGQVRLVDFGFAAPMERSLSSGDIVGTPRYAAPEQLRSPSRVSPRSDLFSLGRVLGELLTGKPPAPLAIAPATQVLDELRERSIRESTIRVVEDLIAERADNRYPDGRAVIADLELARAGRTVRGARAYPKLYRSSTTTVGRHTELESVRTAWSRAASGVGRIVVIGGEQGSGKTHMLAAVAGDARDAGAKHVLEIVSRRGDPPLAGLRRIFEAYVASLRALPNEERDKIAASGKEEIDDRLMSLARFVSPKLDSIFGPGDIQLPEARGAFEEGTAEFLLRLARVGGPILLLVDDAQWLDPVSRDVVTRLAHRSNEAPLLLVLGARREIEARQLAWIDDVHPRSRLSLPLLPFDDARVARLITAYLGTTTAETALVRRVASLGKRTPLAVLELLGTLIDAGALRPQDGDWVIDFERAQNLTLDADAIALFGHRIDDLPPASRHLLTVAAVVGSAFEDALVATAVGLTPEDADYGFADARRGGLIELDEDGRHRFVHDSLREALIKNLEGPTLRSIHQRLAEALDARGDRRLETLSAKAIHYTEGDLTKTPAEAHRATRDAADAALAAFDNETALFFLSLVRKTAEVAKVPLGVSFHRSLGEARLRLGQLEASLASFRDALDATKKPRTKAEILGRIAWVHQAASEPELAWNALKEAFRAVGSTMPAENFKSARAALTQLGRSRMHVPATMAQADVELLSQLHYQNARLGMEYGRPLRLVGSAIHALALTERLSEQPARARALATYGVVASILGRREAGERAIQEGRALAAQLKSESIVAFCAQLDIMRAIFANDLDRAIALAREYVALNATWVDLSEYCLVIMSVISVESVRGRADHAAQWALDVVERVKRSPEISAALTYPILLVLDAAMAARGQPIDDPWVRANLELDSKLRAVSNGFLRLTTWAPRAQRMLERGQFGEPFENFLREFESEGHSPRGAHPFLAVSYLMIAIGRFEQALAAPATERRRFATKLTRAISDLRIAGKMGVFRAHATALQGAVAWLEGNDAKAHKLLTEAEDLGRAEDAPWVLSTAARVRAYILRDAGKSTSVIDQARIAELLAKEHGSEARAARIRAEFGLQPMVQPINGANVSRSTSIHRQLGALLQVMRTPKSELRPELQAAVVLDELIRALDADRGFLLFMPQDTNAEVHLGRARGGKSIAEPDGWREAMMRDVTTRADVWSTDPDDSLAAFANVGADTRRLAVVPMFLYERVVGALCLERTHDGPMFSYDERAQLLVLSRQAPVALEIGRLLVEREQMLSSMQQVQKMEAVGQLAGGIAHDFNNMLAVVRLTVGQIRGHVAPEVAEDIDMIDNAAKRAGELTHRLLAFSRHQSVPLGRHDVNTLLADLEPMVRRLMTARVEVTFDLAQRGIGGRTEPASFGQVVINLAANARDAMTEGGTLTISTRLAEVDETTARSHGVKPGEYAVVEVADSGPGMTAETLARAFDPFFTTKPVGLGTGLGLTMVYALTKNWGGFVDVTSAPGRGTSFRLYLEQVGLSLVPEKRPSKPLSESPSLISSSSGGTILVVDDDEQVRESICRTLERDGYRVIAARDGVAALSALEGARSPVALVVLDILMPGMTGPELAHRLESMGLKAKVLFVSGYAPEMLPKVGAADVDPDFVLMKPFTTATLLGRVRGMLGVNGASSAP